ncbi:hypothetical protein ACOBQJ_13105 [Pelotomaculum propionicicum]|uniref:hypothetical protein n=1 Tax=Pelotomaculum propionicicum TaxID=258475 RepID=UPI003B7F863F
MARVGYDPRLGRIKTDAPGIVLDRAFLANLMVAAADAVAASAAGVLALTNLGAAAQDVSAGITHPAVPRALSIVGNVSGITGNVVLTGTNYGGETITETLALNGTTTVNGAKAFKTITNVNLPAQTHTPAAQTETIEVTHKADAAGTITMTITAAALGDPVPVAVEVEQDDAVGAVAALIAEALNDNEDVAAAFTASANAAVVTLTAFKPLANDGTLAFGFVDTDTTGVTCGASTNGTTGVPYDKVSVGWNDILGLPYRLSHNTVLAAYLNNVKEGTAPSVAISATALESNTIDLNSALDGHAVDVYLIV